MKYLKMLGLAAVVALALPALIGVSSASAGVWCKTKPVGNVCPAGWDFTVGHVITKSLKPGTHANFKAAFSEVTCKKSHTKFDITRTGGHGINPQAKLTEATFQDCTCGERTAHVSATALGEVEVSEAETVTSYSTRFTINCTGLASCIFGSVSGGTDIGTMTDSASEESEAEFDASATLTWSSGEGDSGQFICAGFGDTGTFTATYKLTGTTPTLYTATK